ncbi:MAG: deoxyhypusine synthase [Candidatus Bathyarchaeia archaeon]
MKEKYLKERIKHLNLEEASSIGELIEAMAYTSYQSRNLAYCYYVFKNMLADPDRPTIFLGLAGAMVPGGMRKIIRDMIAYKMIDVLVSTGANLYHDFCEAVGVPHYLGTEHVNDLELRDLHIDRVYDTFLDEDELRKVDELIYKITEQFEPKIYSTREYLHKLGSCLNDENSILYSASKFGVPVFCPALNDSSIGLALSKYYLTKKKANESKLIIDPIRDVIELTQIKMKSKKTGVIFIGGGTPKNYVQQLSVNLDILEIPHEGHHYAIQITTDDPKWGGLSGCTFKEAKSWGKFTKAAYNSTVYADATIALPLLVGAILQNCRNELNQRSRLKFVWIEDELVEIKQST